MLPVRPVETQRLFEHGCQHETEGERTEVRNIRDISDEDKLPRPCLRLGQSVKAVVAEGRYRAIEVVRRSTKRLEELDLGSNASVVEEVQPTKGRKGRESDAHCLSELSPSTVISPVLLERRPVTITDAVSAPERDGEGKPTHINNKYPCTISRLFNPCAQIRFESKQTWSSSLETRWCSSGSY
jgi:hypothetical protein